METNPFAVLSLIVAPAILTNATSVLIMSTSNRLARSVDRARELSKQLEETTRYESEDAQRRLREVNAAKRRALLLLHALRSLYLALGAFASSAFVSLLGAVTAPAQLAVLVITMEIAAVIAGMVAVGAMVYGTVLLLRETKIAVRVISERVENVFDRIERLDPMGSKDNTYP
ncbi:MULTISPECIES: DUF2721 domain-containing protein [unclassified Schlesneria]|uniref:DUF2721 domain-containing protein n=1 Tax=Schlesneria TaxID=656899 RepID=UPI00359F6210